MANKSFYLFIKEKHFILNKIIKIKYFLYIDKILMLFFVNKKHKFLLFRN